MEKPADQTDAVSVANAVDLQSPDRKVSHRRFVQSTLFPLKPHDTKVENCVQKEVKKVQEIDHDDDDDDEFCGSQGGKKRRKRKSKGNATPWKRGSKKVAVNEKDASIVAIDDIESPDDRSPQHLKAKQHVATRKGRANGNNRTSMGNIPTQPIAAQQASPPVPDLWLEAKRTAEENSRIFAGKQIHPFFASWKAGKKDQVTTQVESNGCLDRRKERNIEFGPIHVFEDVKDDSNSINWSNFTFHDGTFSKTTCNQERAISSLEGTCSLNFDDLNISNPSDASLLLNDVSLSQFLGAYEDNTIIPPSISPIEVDEEVKPNELLRNIEKDFEDNECCPSSGHVGYANSVLEEPKSVLQERMMSYYLSRGNWPENSLWTNKYQPEKALEVCGNSEAVKFINDWLHLWNATDFRVSKRSYGADKCLMKDKEFDSYDSESDLENVDEAFGLKNVLLVTGPVGSGKSAAIYACAKEQGFQVIEVNASDWRNGALLKQKFGEAVGSHWLKRSQENSVASQSRLNLKSSPAVHTNGPAAQDLNNGVVEVISVSEEEDCVGDVGMQCHSDGILACDQGEIKTLILFEDVDASLCEDRGFISSIQQLADTGKRPMILTSNNENPVLPDNLDREEVCFAMPSLKELICHIYLVCATEKANVQPYLIERCVEFCGGDIRKTLMHLQFWCQSKGCMKDGKMRSISSPLMFNFESGHCTLPKLIPWELPSVLSEIVEAEICKSLRRMEETHSLLEVIGEEEEGNTNMQNKLYLFKDEIASIEAKKEAILRGNCFLHVENDIAAVSNTCELSNSSGSPVAFTRRHVRRKMGTVMSDSEDEISNHANRAVSDSLPDDDYNSLVPAVDSHLPIPCPALQDIPDRSGDLLPHSGATEVEAARHQSSETAHVDHIDFFAVGNSCSQSTDHFQNSTEANFVEIQHQHLESVQVNHNSCNKASNTLNLFNDLLFHVGEASMEVNEHQFPVIGHVYKKFPTVGNPRNQSADQPFHFGETNALEIGIGNTANQFLNPLSDQLQHCGETKMPVERCLFPQTAHADPINCTIGSPWNQSTEQLSQCREASMAKPSHWHLEIGIVNHSSLGAADVSLNPLFDQLPCHREANVENSEQQHPETANANSFSYTVLNDSLNHSSDQLFHSAEVKGKEIQHQYPETADQDICAAVGDPFNQLSSQFLGMAKLEEIQLQNPGSADADHSSSPPIDDSLKQMNNQFHVKETKAESVQYQFPDMVNVDLISCPAADNSMNPLNDRILKFIETKAEEHQCQYSDATKVNHVIDRCQSVDMSCVPESTFVPETEVNDGTEIQSGTDLMEIVSRVSVDNVDPSILRHQASESRQCRSGIDVNARDEEMGDSQSENEHLEASTSGCGVMDECSRMDFCRRSKSFRSSRLEAKNPVQESWNELQRTDLRQYFISEHESAIEVLELAHKMSNLTSEGDLLLRDCKFLINDSSDQETGFSDENFTVNWHDQQVQMALAIAQHGYCLYGKDIDSLQSKMGMDSRVHLAWEMLASTSNSMALGKLLRLNRSRSQISWADRSVKWAGPTVDTLFTREREMCLQNIVQSVVPLKSFLSVRGNVLHEYLSSLAHISRSESSRLAEAVGEAKRRRRRVRVTKNYLTSGALDLSQDDISKLNGYSCYRKV